MTFECVVASRAVWAIVSASHWICGGGALLIAVASRGASPIPILPPHSSESKSNPKSIPIHIYLFLFTLTHHLILTSSTHDIPLRLW